MASMMTPPCETVRMPAKPKRPREPRPKSDATRRLNDLMTRMEKLDEEALQVRMEFGSALKEERNKGLSQDEIVRELDANRELLRRIQRRYEKSLET